MVAKFRERDADTPVVLMGYLNPIEIMGRERFAAAHRSRLSPNTSSGVPVIRRTSHRRRGWGR